TASTTTIRLTFSARLAPRQVKTSALGIRRYSAIDFTLTIGTHSRGTVTSSATGIHRGSHAARASIRAPLLRSPQRQTADIRSRVGPVAAGTGTLTMNSNQSATASITPIPVSPAWVVLAARRPERRWPGAAYARSGGR